MKASYLYICETCGESYRTFDYRSKRHFCCQPCFRKAFSAKVEVVCAHCKKTFIRLKSRLKPYKVFYCSSKCLREQGIPKVILVCPNCHKNFEIKNSKYKYLKKLGKEKFITCSKSCRVAFTSQQKRSPYSPFLQMFYASSHNAKGIPCELSLSDIADMWKRQNGLCDYSGVPMFIPKCAHDKTKTPFKVSIDRIDSNLPYTKENTHLVCAFVNLGKNRHNDKAIKEFFEILKNQYQNNAPKIEDYSI